MRARLRIVFSLFVIVSLLFGQAAIVTAQGPAKDPSPLRVTGAGEIPPGLQAAALAEHERGYFVVQFAGPVEQAWKDAVSAEGAELLDYLPDFAFKVRMNPGQARKVAALPFVAQVGAFHPAYKLAPDLALGELGLYSVQVERGADRGLARAAIAATGVEVSKVEDARIVVVATPEQLQAIARVLDVAYIENFALYQTMNEEGGGVIMGAALANSRGYDGSTQTVAVADTGIGGGTITTVHRDIPSTRVTAIYNWPGATDSCFKTIYDDGAIDVDSGHGTHTAGSVLSAGDPAGIGKGVAPAAKLVFQSTENYVVTSSLCKTVYGYLDGYYLTGLPADLKTLFQQAYNAGARIHSNSWGSPQAGIYSTDSSNADAFVWSNKDMVITFSAGNEGIDANSDGVIDNDSIGAPGTAKNVITVGASENYRPAFTCDAGLLYTTCSTQGGVNSIFTWGTAWPSDYPANPIKNDPSAGNKEQMAAFSSRGPTDDGRIKPDVVAPGSWILSAYSDLYQQGYDATANPRNGAWQYDGWGFPLNSYYKYMGGTSMSNPLVAGGAAVVKDYFQKTANLNASAALVKAVLVNTAVDMADENNDGVNDNDFPIPNNNEGWGRVNLDAATDGRVKYVEAAGLATNATATYTVTPTGGPLKITVAWSDYQAAANATVTLVNDLDVSVTNGTSTYLGNVFSGGWSNTGGSADRRNNLENVYVASPSGTYTVTVKGYNVPQGPQPYALVITGGTIGTPPPPTAPTAPTGLTANAASSSQINLTWTDASNNEDGFKIERCSGAGCTDFAQIATVGANVTSYANTGLTASTSYSYRVRAYNAGGDSGYSNTASATTQAAPAVPAAPTNLSATVISRTQINLAWTDNATNETGYYVERCKGSTCTNFTRIATLTANTTAYQNINLAKNTTYRYRVQAYNAAGVSSYSNIINATTPR